jgi:hypothetical protein
LLVLTLLAGAVQFYLSLRTAFDRSVFASWCAAWQLPHARPEDEMQAFDAGIGRPIDADPDSLARRIRGARRLLTWQMGCLLMQGLAIGAALLVGR